MKISETMSEPHEAGVYIRLIPCNNTVETGVEINVQNISASIQRAEPPPACSIV